MAVTVADLSLFGWLICTIVDDSNHGTSGHSVATTSPGAS